MAFTDNCDIFGAIHEKSFNNIVLQLQRQRPSLFNYGTMTFARRPELMCNQRMIRAIDPEVVDFKNPIVKEEPLFAIPGYSGPFGLEYCLQLTELSIDFHPGNIHVLPAELGPPLKEQHFSLRGQACAGLDCPTASILRRLAPDEPAFFPVVSKGSDFIHQQEPPREQHSPDGPIVTRTPVRPFPFNPDGRLCFCLDLFAVLHVERLGGASNPVISLQLDNLEIVDVAPDRLESAIECFLRATLIMGVLPKVKLALNALAFNIAGVLNIGPTPISAAVPFNPAIEDDQIKARISVSV